MMNTIKIAALAVTSSIMLAACGGGGSGGASNEPPVSVTAAAGLWEGTTGNRAVKGLVLNTGEYYMLYSMENQPTTIAGMITGTISTRNGTSTSTDARDFSLETRSVVPATITASLREKQTFAGNVNYQTGVVTSFSTKYNSVYETQATAEAITGTFALSVATAAGVEQAVMPVSTAGAFSTKTSKGCLMSGTITPRPNENVYNVKVKFGPAPCVLANQTATGIAFYDAPVKTMYALGMSADKNTGLYFIGLKK